MESSFKNSSCIKAMCCLWFSCSQRDRIQNLWTILPLGQAAAGVSFRLEISFLQIEYRTLMLAKYTTFHVSVNEIFKECCVSN